MTCPWDPDEPTLDQEIDLGLIELERWLSTATAPHAKPSSHPPTPTADGKAAAPGHGAKPEPKSSKPTPPAPTPTAKRKQRKSTT